jgi:hypothetical protein
MNKTRSAIDNLSIAFLIMAICLASCTVVKPDKVFVLENKWMDALVRKDTAQIVTLLHPKFILNGSNEKNETREQYLMTSIMPDRKLEPIELKDREAFIEGKSIISTGTAEYKGQWKENEFHLRVRYTYVWVHAKKGWKVLTAHLSVLK